MNNSVVNNLGTFSDIGTPWTLRDTGKGLLVVIAGTSVLALGVMQAVRLTDSPTAITVFLVSALLEGMLLLAVYLFGPRKYGQSWGALGLQATLNNGVTLALWVFLASLSFAMVYAAAVTTFDINSLKPPQLPDQALSTYPLRIIGFVVIVLLAPVAEEVFFRGFLLPVFAQRWGFLGGATLASGLFAVSHVTPGAILPAFVAGMLFAWLYRRTDSLWNCCLAHGAQNALAFALTVSL
jgi:membrane protease YdiL (CAAX protease family)